MTMIRKQFLIDKEKSRRLRELAEQKGLSEADLIRLGVDRVLGDEPLGEESADAGRDWKQRLLSVAGSLKDTEHLERTIKENRARWGRRVDRTRRKLAGD